ncbi:hypothetical protein AB1278_00265 [Chryseobacterium sp. NRRL B-14798]|uniref:hypothetical protein n=1 Tax=Chryseobacterium sp. NRRL B-14798 TaxID=3162880 RepID=UPI003D1D952D
MEFVSKQKGYYVGMDRTLRYALTAEKITVDGTVVTPYDVIDYNFPFCIKKLINSIINGLHFIKKMQSIFA